MSPGRTPWLDGYSALRRKKIRQFYLNGNLHKVVHVNRAKDLLTAFDYQEGKMKIYPWSDVKRQKQNAFTITEAAKLIGRHKDRIVRYMREEEIVKPQREYNTETGRMGRYFFSEEDMLKMHEFFASIHIGRPRKDGKVTNNMLPTRQELRLKMQSGQRLLYTDDETSMPVWMAEVW
jgi:hypothetical protein